MSKPHNVEDSDTSDDSGFRDELILNAIPKRRFSETELNDADIPFRVTTTTCKVPSSKLPRSTLSASELLARREQDSAAQAQSVANCRYTIFFLAYEINTAHKGIVIEMEVSKKRASLYKIPFTFDMFIKLTEPFPQELVDLVELSNSMNTIGMKRLATKRSHQTRKKMTLWRNVLYKLAEAIGFQLILSKHTGRSDKSSDLPKELIDGRNLLTCITDKCMYNDKEILRKGEAIYNSKINSI